MRLRLTLCKIHILGDERLMVELLKAEAMIIRKRDG